jgi:uncharacterized membrane protein YcaP (DUF421 family)
METIDLLFGHGSDLNTLQMTLRAIVIFFLALIMIRMTGMRAFGIKSAFDTCIIIILGAVLARAIVGASPFIPTVVASASLMVIHKILAMLSVNNQFVSHLIKGNHIQLYKDGILNEKNMKKCSLSYGDIMEEVRLGLNQNTMNHISEIYMERTGKISVIEKSAN